MDKGGPEAESALESAAIPDPHPACGHPLPVGEGLKKAASRCGDTNAFWGG